MMETIKTIKAKANKKLLDFLILAVILGVILAGYLYIMRVVRTDGSADYVNAFAAQTETLRIPVLAYHSVLSPEYYYPINVNNPWIMSTDLFREHMQYLYDNGFTPITSRQLMRFLYCECDNSACCACICDCVRMPSKPVLITFDDGYLDNVLFAAPILREFGFTAMVFVITDRLAEETPVMARYPTPWMSVTEMLENTDVFEFGSHTHNLHSFIGPRAALEVTSREDIREDLRRSLEFPINMRQGFAYPFGIYSDNAIAVLKEEGVRFAFTTEWGYITDASDPFRLPRFNITSAPDCRWNDTEFFSSIIRGTLEF